MLRCPWLPGHLRPQQVRANVSAACRRLGASEREEIEGLLSPEAGKRDRLTKLQLRQAEPPSAAGVAPVRFNYSRRKLEQQ
jgi:hypothetical protein